MGGVQEVDLAQKGTVIGQLVQLIGHVVRLEARPIEESCQFDGNQPAAAMLPNLFGSGNSTVAGGDSDAHGRVHLW